MKRVEKVTVWKCEFCGKRSFKNNTYHEIFCKHNPENKNRCFEFCKHLKRTPYFPVTEFTCLALNQKMYSYLAIKKRIDITGLVKMPKTCKYYEALEDDGEGYYLTEKVIKQRENEF